MASVMEKYREVELSKLRPAEDNPRQEIGDVTELAQSIKAQGIIAPLVVIDAKDGTFTIVAGHRRFAAAKEAKLKEVPVLVREMSDQQRLEVMLVENLQREDLTVIEEAQSYQRLIDQVGYSQRDLAERVGRGQSHISKRISLLALPAKVQDDIAKGKLNIQDAEQLARLKTNAEAVERILRTFKDDPFASMRTLVDTEIAEEKRVHKLAQVEKSLLKKGFTIVPQDDWQAGSAWTVEGDKPTDKTEYVGIDDNGKVVVLTPRSETAAASVTPIRADEDGESEDYEGAEPEGEPEQPVKLSAAEKRSLEAQEKVKAHEKALRDAREGRFDAMSEFVSKRVSKTAVWDLVTDAFIRGVNSNTASLAVKLLGLEPTLEDVEHSGPRDVLRHNATEGTEALNRTVAAIAMAENELSVRGTWVQWPTSPEVKIHFDFLKTIGYAPTAAEKKELAGKAPHE